MGRSERGRWSRLLLDVAKWTLYILIFFAISGAMGAVMGLGIALVNGF